jgi:hypothetical protein
MHLPSEYSLEIQKLHQYKGTGTWEDRAHRGELNALFIEHLDD